MTHPAYQEGNLGNLCRQMVLLVAIMLLPAMPSWAQETGKPIDVGVAWQGKSMMPERVLAGMQNTLAEHAPEIRLEVRKELDDLAALEKAVTEFEASKQAMVIMRSNGAQLLGRRGAAIPSFIGAATNPVELGAAFAMDKPRPNICGVTYYIPARIKLDTFRQVYPPMKNYLLLVEHGHPGSPIDADETAEAAPGLGLTGKTVSCETIDEALAAIKSAGEDVSIIIGSQALLIDNAGKIVEAAGLRPVFSYSERPVEAGALAGMVADDKKLGQMLGSMLIDVLVDSKPMAEMPFQTDPEPRLRLNRKALERFRSLIPFPIQSLAQTQQLMESILKSAPAGIGVVENRVIAQVNEYILDLTGYTREELIGQSTRLLYPTQEDYDNAGLEAYSRTVDQGSVPVETRWICKDGSIRHVSIALSLLDPLDITGGYAFAVTDITDRKLAESALKESEERFSRAFMASPAPLSISDIATGRFIAVNDRCVDLLGYSREELLGRTSREIGIWSDAAQRDRAIAKLGKNNGLRNEPITFINRSGAEIFTLWSGEIISLGGKEVLLSIFIDQTERVRSEAALAARTRAFHIAMATFIILLLAVLLRLFISLRQRKSALEALRNSEEKYRTLVDNAAEAIFIIQDGMFKFCNKSLSDISGYGLDDLINKPFIDLIHPEDQRMVFDRYIQRMEGKNVPYRYSFRFMDVWGATRWIDVNVALISWDEKPASLCLAMDITEQKRDEEIIRLDEKRLESLLNLNLMTDASESELTHFAMEAAVRLTNSSIGYIAFASEDETVLNMYAWSSEAMRECAINDKPVVYRVSETGLWGEAIRQRRAVITNDYAAPNPLKKGVPDGHVLVRRHMNAPLFDGDRIVIVAGVGNKPTDYGADDVRQLTLLMSGLWTILSRKRAEEERNRLRVQLTRAQKLESIGTLAGGIAHDFNNLLMGIEGNASLMMLDTDPSHPHYERLKHIETHVESGANLTRQLLGFARGGRYDVKPVSMNDIIEKSSEMFGRTKKEITIHRKYAKDPCVVEVDHAQIEQVLMNLFVNAWQAMPGGGDIFIETEKVVLDQKSILYESVKPGYYVKITITDTGAGMDRETMNRIFDPFFTTKEIGRGSGLGLASAYGIIKGHNGMINVYSEPGHGTTFTLYIPASLKDPDEQSKSAEGVVLGNETILLVDDEKMILDVSRDMLESLGYRVYMAGNFKEATSVYIEKQYEIDLVILDMIMPGVSGRNIFDQLREINPGVKVLLASGYSINGEAQAILDRGCNGFIQKPFRLNELSRRVREVMDS